MRNLWAGVVVLSLVAGSHGLAQEKPSPIPPRFNALAKNDRFRLVRVLGMPELPANSPSSFSADGKYALFAEDFTSGAEKKPRSRLLLFDLKAKTWPREFDIVGKSVAALSLSSDGSKVLLGGSTIMAPCLYLFDLKTGKANKTIMTNEFDFYALALAPDGVTALVSGVVPQKFFGDVRPFETNLKQWNIKDGNEIAIYNEGYIPAVALAYLPDGKRFLAGYHAAAKAPGVLRWDLGKPNGNLDKPKSFPYKNAAGAWHLAVSRDGKRFAAGDFLSTVSLWETDTGKEINTLRAEKKAVEQDIIAVAIADDGKTVLSVWSKRDPAPDDFACARLVAWDGEANKTLWSHSVSYRGRPPILVQGDRLLVGGGPNLFETWSIKDGKRLQSWGGHKSVVNAVAVLPYGDVLSAGQEGELMAWSKGQFASKRPAHAGAINVLVLSADEKQMLSGGGDKTIKLWATDADKPIHVFKGHSGPVTSLAFGNKEKWATSGSSDRSVKTWDLATGKEIATFTGHSEGVTGVAISPDGSWLASASDDATIRLWPVKAGRLDPDREAILLDDHKKAVTCLAFSPDGKTLLSGSQDKTLIVWDWRKGKATRTIPGHKNWITSLLFIDANTAVSTSDDLTLCWWDLNSGKEIGRVDFGAVGDCPRCLAHAGPDRLLVGSSSWLIYELQMLPTAKTKKAAGSSK